MDAYVQVRELRKVYRQKGSGAPVVAIERLDLEIPRGQVVAIVGQTGCGKSTFLNILIGLERPTSGVLRVDGRAPYEEFAYFRGKIGAVFQQDRLLPWRTALENVALGLEILGVPLARRRAEMWLERVGLAAFRDAFPGELSGGMRQRVALARAFAVDPDLLVADEAFGHLDEVTAYQIRQEFLRLVREERKTAVFVTHQIEEALQVGERVLVFGKPATVLADLQAPEASRRGRMREWIQRMLGENRSLPERESPEASEEEGA